MSEHGRRAGIGLRWSEVERCLIVAVATVWFPVIFALVGEFIYRRPADYPWIDAALRPWVITGLLATVAGWLILIAAGLVLRARTQESRALVHATLLYWMSGSTFILYCSGTVTSPFVLLLVGGAMAGMLLFDLRTILPTVSVIVLALLAISVAEHQAWIPYAPVLLGPPLVDGRPSDAWVGMWWFLFLPAGALLLALSAYLVDQRHADSGRGPRARGGLHRTTCRAAWDSRAISRVGLRRFRGPSERGTGY